jgi:hypothetical protein
MEKISFDYELIEMKFKRRYLSPAKIIEKSTFKILLVPETLELSIPNVTKIPNSLFDDIAVLIQEGKITTSNPFQQYPMEILSATLT